MRHFWINVQFDRYEQRYFAIVEERRAGRVGELEDTIFERFLVTPPDHLTEKEAYVAAVKLIDDRLDGDEFETSPIMSLVSYSASYSSNY